MKSFLIIFCCFSFAVSQSWREFGSNEYFIGQDEVEYAVAEDACQMMNASLVIVSDEAVQSFLLEMLSPPADKADAFWIGLNRINSTENEFQWVDGTALNHSNWNPGELQNINTNNENCVIMGHPCCSSIDYRWFAVPCNGAFSERGMPSYICQRPKRIMANRTDELTTTTAQVTSLPLSSTSASITREIMQTTTLSDTTITSKPSTLRLTTTSYLASTTKPTITTTKLTSTRKTTESLAKPTGPLQNFNGVELEIVLPIVLAMLLIICILIFFIVYKRKENSSVKENSSDAEINSRATIKIDKDDISLPYIDEPPEPEAAIYETTSLETINEKGPRKPMYTQVNKAKHPSDRKSLEITDEETGGEDEAFYTTIPMNDDAQYVDTQSIDNQVADTADPDPYITFSDMQSLSDSTYSLRHSVHDVNGLIQPNGNLYDALDQSR